MTHGIIPGDLDSAAKAFTDFKIELDKEKTTQKAAQIEVIMLAWADKDLKISADKFAARIPTPKEQVKHLEVKVVDGLNGVRARELCLERTTWANDDYKEQNDQLTKKLEGKSHGLF
jgi:hypothetical protein